MARAPIRTPAKKKVRRTAGQSTDLQTFDNRMVAPTVAWMATSARLLALGSGADGLHIDGGLRQLSQLDIGVFLFFQRYFIEGLTVGALKS